VETQTKIIGGLITEFEPAVLIAQYVNGEWGYERIYRDGEPDRYYRSLKEWKNEDIHKID